MIPEAEAFNDAAKAYKDLNAARKELEIDLAIAKRGGDEEAIKAAQAAFDASPWYESYKARREAGLLLCNAIGVSPDELKAAIY